jgi:hypothetical protein
LSVLLLFAVGVLILSIVMPRVQERRQGFETFQHAVSVYGVVSPEAEQHEPMAGSSEAGDGSDLSSPPGETT